jgi:hypothetical protein
MTEISIARQCIITVNQGVGTISSICSSEGLGSVEI